MLSTMGLDFQDQWSTAGKESEKKMSICAIIKFSFEYGVERPLPMSYFTYISLSAIILK